MFLFPFGSDKLNHDLFVLPRIEGRGDEVLFILVLKDVRNSPAFGAHLFQRVDDILLLVVQLE